MPATWRDPLKARATQQRHDDLREGLAKLYAHDEQAVQSPG